MKEQSWPNLESVVQDIAREGLMNAQKIRAASDLQAAVLIKQIRSRYGSMVFVEIDVLVPLCQACRHSKYRWYETAFPQLPHVFSEDWRRNYLEMGILKKKVREASKALRNGTWRGPGCYQCGSVIGLNIRGGEGFYLKTISISSFYSLNRGNGRRPPEWMRKIVFDASEGKCSGCGITMTSNQATYDHIVPVSGGGETHIENLQLMCQRCNNEDKRNLTVEQVKHPPLYFPLLPPSDNLLY